MNKICTCCKTEKPETEYRINKKRTRKDGSISIYMNSQCAKCVSKKKLAYERKNREAVYERHKKWAEKNIEKVREYRNKWKQNNPEKYKDSVTWSKMSEQRKINKRIGQIKWRKNNPEKIRAIEKRYALKNVEKTQEKRARQHATQYFKRHGIEKNEVPNEFFLLKAKQLLLTKKINEERKNENSQRDDL